MAILYIFEQVEQDPPANAQISCCFVLKSPMISAFRIFIELKIALIRKCVRLFYISFWEVIITYLAISFLN